jgi:6-phosphogluconolactonase
MDDAGANRSLLPREVLPGVLVCADSGEVARMAARRFVDWAWQAIARDGKFQVALSGGATPLPMYRLLATQEFRTQIDWPRVHLFWGDERAVPPEHPDSNYGMARRELLLRVPIPAENIHRMRAEMSPIGSAAHQYESVLRQCLPVDDRGFPLFHLVLLGMGADGHIASLFPGAKLLRETTRWVSTPTNDQTGARRMTLTLPVIEAAERILFLVTGIEKATMLRLVLCGTADRQIPAQMVQPRHGQRIFLVDDAAARLLPADAQTPASPGTAQSDRS